MSNQALDSGGSLKLPGETNPEFSRVVREYLSRFEYYKIKRDYAIRAELYEWCAEYMGEKYKDWFIHEGNSKDKHWVVNIRNPKHGTLFSLKWSDIIDEHYDRRSST